MLAWKWRHYGAKMAHFIRILTCSLSEASVRSEKKRSELLMIRVWHKEARMECACVCSSLILLVGNENGISLILSLISLNLSELDVLNEFMVKINVI